MTTAYYVTVIGIGAMGGGMARALLRSDEIDRVIGYDRSADLVQRYFDEAQSVDKTCSAPPKTLSEAIDEKTNVVVLVLVNELQCQHVCFDAPENLFNLLPSDSTVILCSTVSATWAKKADQAFASKNVNFVDCPISGGPVRARAGELTMMASACEALDRVMPVIHGMGKDVHVIAGGVGMGSTVKMVHQLLAGVHIVVAAEALALAAKAGLDPQQMYDIIQGAAGASWMFGDRGKRMLLTEDPPVMSALGIFVKDLDIVYSEARSLQSPIPIASAALQQFISGQSLGLSQKDDSQVVKVYENVTGVKVRSVTKRKEGSQVGDYWRMDDGKMEQILEVGDEPRHNVVLSNDYVRALKVTFPARDTTFAHRHAQDSLYFFLVKDGINVVNHVQGSEPKCDCMEFGEVRFGKHKTEEPLVHKITATDKDMICIDAEVLKQPPVTAIIPLVAEYHECIKTRDKCRVYRLRLPPGKSVIVTYPFFFLTVVVRPGVVSMQVGSEHPIEWQANTKLGEVEWHHPIANLQQTNIGDEDYEVYIAEWR
jgi:3-hydroxyisobutyrate dehydrogenase-like beta-hydroxyacid dehydrogenase